MELHIELQDPAWLIKELKIQFLTAEMKVVFGKQNSTVIIFE